MSIIKLTLTTGCLIIKEIKYKPSDQARMIVLVYCVGTQREREGDRALARRLGMGTTVVYIYVITH